MLQCWGTIQSCVHLPVQLPEQHWGPYCMVCESRTAKGSVSAQDLWKRCQRPHLALRTASNPYSVPAQDPVYSRGCCWLEEALVRSLPVSRRKCWPHAADLSSTAGAAVAPCDVGDVRQSRPRHCLRALHSHIGWKPRLAWAWHRQKLTSGSWCCKAQDTKPTRLQWLDGDSWHAGHHNLPFTLVCLFGGGGILTISTWGAFWGM